MLDTLLSVFSPKHKLYKNLKLKPFINTRLVNSDSIAMTDVFPFHQIKDSLCKTGISPTNFVPGKNIVLNPHAKDNNGEFTVLQSTKGEGDKSSDVKTVSLSASNSQDNDSISYLGQDTQNHKPFYISTFAEELAEVFNPIFVETIHLETPCLLDLSEIGGFLNSKSDLSQYRTIDDFVQNACPDYINDVSMENLDRMLLWPEIRLVNSPETTTDSFAIFGWCPKIFVQNAGGSHHMAAAHYLAKKLSQCVPIQGKVSINLISNTALQNFDSKYAAFAVPHDALIDMGNDLSESGLEYQLVFFREREVDFIFFKKNDQNARVISLFNNLHASLNSALKSAVHVQFNNEALLTIMSDNVSDTSKDEFFSTRPHLAEIYNHTQNEICLNGPKPTSPTI